MRDLKFGVSALVMIFCAIINAAGHVAEKEENRDSLVIVNADWHWKQLDRGAEVGYVSVRIFGSIQSISAIRYPASKFRTKILHRPGQESLTTELIASQAGYVLAVNGSYFNMRELTPVTFLSLDHNVISVTSDSETFRTNGILAFRRANGRKMEISYCDSTEYDNCRKRNNMAIASGPVLIKNGEVSTFRHDEGFYDKRHPRTIIGQDNMGNYWFIVIDGRFPGKADGTTIPETAAVARYLGLEDAINFDGGGSSTLWTKETGIVNHPCDNKKFDHAGTRRVPNVIVAK